MTNIITKLFTLCLLTAPVLQAVGPMPERKMIKDEVKQTAKQIIWELTTPESAPLTIADTVAANDATLAQAAQTARQQAAERSKREEQERAQRAAEYQASLIKVADIADANVEAELVPAPAKKADAQPVATTVPGDIGFHKEAKDIADFVYSEQKEQMRKEQEEQEQKDNKHVAEQQTATVNIADIVHAPIAVNFVPGKATMPELPVATEFIPARPETPEDTRAYDKAQMHEIWTAHEVHEVNQQDVRAVIAAERANNKRYQQAQQTATGSTMHQVGVQAADTQNQDTAVATQGLGTWCDYIKQYQATWDREHRTSLTTKAAGLGLGLLLAYLAYKSLKWVYDNYTPGPSKIKGPKQAKHHGRPAGKRYPKPLKKA